MNPEDYKPLMEQADPLYDWSFEVQTLENLLAQKVEKFELLDKEFKPIRDRWQQANSEIIIIRGKLDVLKKLQRRE